MILKGEFLTKNHPVLLAGMRALIRLENDKLYAQFDDMRLLNGKPNIYAFGWHEFEKKEFRIYT